MKLGIETIGFTLISEAPLLMHSGRLVDPTNRWTQAMAQISGKSKKTDTDLEQLRELEWFGSLYVNANKQVAIPADNLLTCVVEGARKSKRGKEAEAGVYETQPFYPLIYDGPKDLEQLFHEKGFCDYRAVRVQRSRVMRARPRFDSWRLNAQLFFDPELISQKKILEAIETSGLRVGLGDFRPRYGRFRVERHE